MVFTEGTSSIATTHTSKDGFAAPATTEEVEEEDGGLQRRRFKQPAIESTREVPLSIPPICQILFMPPSSKFLRTLGTSFNLSRAFLISLSDFFWCLLQIGLWWLMRRW